jgi:NaMN:DMB phosphoribosyltransferase
MSNDKEKLSQLSTRVDELLNTINKITEELRSISATLKLLSITQTQTQPKTTTTITTDTTTPKPTNPKPIYTTSVTTITNSTTTTPSQTETKIRTLDDVRMSFPEELEAKLDFEDKRDYIAIKPKQFLGSDNFAKIAAASRDMNGEYISAGKDSHFRIPKKKNLN